MSVPPMHQVHDVAERGFGTDAATYERVRPGYPSDLVSWFRDHLRLGVGTVALDVAAGTGKLTRELVTTGATVVAVEPVAGMRTVLGRELPGVPAMAAVAESLPIADRTLDAVTVAQAFHWFDPDAATRELARVLRPGGRLGLVWNARDRSAGWAHDVWGVLDRVEKRAPWSGHEEWRDTLARGLPGFGPVHETTFRHQVASTPDEVVDRIGSVSHVAVLAEAERTAVLDEVRTLLGTHPDTAGRETVAMPYRVDAYWCERS